VDDQNARATVQQQLDAGFNGATANSPWMTAWDEYIRSQKDALQWGHGEFAVDDSRTEPANALTD